MLPGRKTPPINQPTLMGHWLFAYLLCVCRPWRRLVDRVRYNDWRPAIWWTQGKLSTTWWHIRILKPHFLYNEGGHVLVVNTRQLVLEEIPKCNYTTGVVVGGWEFYILVTSKVISSQAPTCDSAQSWWLHSAAPLGKSGHRHHDLISHTVTLSWHWAKQSLPYRNKAQHLTRKQQVSIL